MKTPQNIALLEGSKSLILIPMSFSSASKALVVGLTRKSKNELKKINVKLSFEVQKVTIKHI